MNYIKGQVILYTQLALRFRRQASKRGQTLVEYALILTFISVLAVSILYSMSVSVSALFTAISSQLARAPGGAGYVGP